ncbi:MAG: LysR substrate-binding domain-containing protein [Mucinivorans sp.]
MDFRLRVFLAVASNLNFTKAALELHISQPAISKHIQELEGAYGVQLFERSGGRIALTTAGQIFRTHAIEIIESYRALGLEMNLLTGRFSGTLRIGASTTIAQYVLPPLVARFIERFSDIRLTMLSGNSEQIERALVDRTIDLGLVESASRHAGLRYAAMADDRLVMIVSARSKLKERITIDELRILPLVVRESGSGTLEVIENKLAEHNVSLSEMNILLQLGSTESIKVFLSNCPSACAIVSRAALNLPFDNELFRIIEVDDVNFDRQFSFVNIIGSKNELVEKFMWFVSDNYKL